MTQLGKDRGPYSLDVVKVRHKNATITTIVNSPVFDDIITNLEDAYTYEVGLVPAGYEHRPDLIANTFYGDAANWWLLMLVNTIPDPNQGFKINERILIPKIR
jgi:hypothetical protein